MWPFRKKEITSAIAPLADDEVLEIINGEPLYVSEDWDDLLDFISRGGTEEKWLKKRQRENRPVRYRTKTLQQIEDDKKCDKHFENLLYVKEHYSAALKDGIFSPEMDRIVEICEADIVDNLQAVERWHIETSAPGAGKLDYYMFWRLRVIYDKRKDPANSDRIKKLAEELGYTS